MIKEGFHEVLAAVLVVKIVGMFPYVTCEERRLAARHRRICVGGFDDLQRVALPYKPGPSAAELRDRRGYKGLLELIEAAEGLLDLFQKAPRGFAATAGFHALPEKRVVPALRGFVDHGLLVCRADGFPDYRIQRLPRQRGSRDQLIEVIDISLMMLAVMEAHSLGGHVRSQGVLGIGQRRQLKLRLGVRRMV